MDAQKVQNEHGNQNQFINAVSFPCFKEASAKMVVRVGKNIAAATERYLRSNGLSDEITLGAEEGRDKLR